MLEGGAKASKVGEEACGKCLSVNRVVIMRLYDAIQHINGLQVSFFLGVNALSLIHI